MSSGKVRETDLSNHFAVESHLLSGIWSDVYKAIDKTSGRAVSLSIFRSRLEDRVGADDAFLERLALLSEELGSLVSLQRCGVDSSGVAFATLPSLDGRPMVGGSIDPVEGERRFLGATRIIEQLHHRGIIAGDITDGSFWIDRSGSVRFIGVMGPFAGFFQDEESKTPHKDSAPYLPPEGSDGSAQGDVFALGVLGYRLFTGSFPPREGMTSLPTRGTPPPPWAEAVLKKCLQRDPKDRFSSAKELYGMIQEVRERSSSASNMPATPLTGGAITKVAPRESQIILGPSMRNRASSAKTDKAAGSTRFPLKTIATASVAGILALSIGGFLLLNPKKAPPVVNPVTVDGSLPMPSGETIQGEAPSAQDLQSLDDAFRKLSQSSDPVSQETLIEKASSAASTQIRQLAESALLERSRRLGGLRTAELIRRWLSEPTANELYRPLLRLLDPTVPSGIKDELLKTVFAKDSALGLSLAAARYLDVPAETKAGDLVKELVSAALPELDVTNRAAPSLILAHPGLAVEFGEDVIQRRIEIPDKDVLWLVVLLANRHDVSVRPLANLALDRKLASSVRNGFLTLLRDRSDLPPGVTRLLASAAQGAINPSDISVLGSWKDKDVEKVLLGILGSTTDSNIAREALDTLAGQTISTEPAASLIRWIRDTHWPERTEFTRLLGVLTFPKDASAVDFDSAFVALDKFGKDKKLVDILLAADIPEASLAIVQRYPALIGVPRALNLLSNPSPEVRLAAIDLLKETNDLGAMKLMVDRFSAEKDPKIRQKYRDSFWFIRERT